MTTLKTLSSYKKLRDKLGAVKKHVVDASFPLFVVGQGVCVEHPHYHGKGVVESDTDCTQHDRCTA